MRITDLLGETLASDMANSLVNLVTPSKKIPAQQAALPKSTATQPVKPTATEPPEFKPAEHKSMLTAMAKQVFRNPADLANFLGQSAHETANWTKASESFNYTSPQRILNVFTSKFANIQQAAKYVGNPIALANRALADKNGNGNEASGDGWRYRGRGFLHITGRENYAKAGAAVHPRNPNIFVDTPTLISSNPQESAKVAIWFFQTKVGLGKSSAQATKKVAGSNIGAKQRQKYTQAELQAINQRPGAAQGAKPQKKAPQ